MVFGAVGILLTVRVAMMLLVHAFMQHLGLLKGVAVAGGGGKDEGGGAEQGRGGFHEGRCGILSLGGGGANGFSRGNGAIKAASVQPVFHLQAGHLLKIHQVA